MASQQTEQGKLLGGEFQPITGARHPTRQQIQVHIVDLQLGDVCPIDPATAHQGLNTGNQFNEREGFGQIVIGPRRSPLTRSSTDPRAESISTGVCLLARSPSSTR